MNWFRLPGKATKPKHKHKWRVRLEYALQGMGVIARFAKIPLFPVMIIFKHLMNHASKVVPVLTDETFTIKYNRRFRSLFKLGHTDLVYPIKDIRSAAIEQPFSLDPYSPHNYHIKMHLHDGTIVSHGLGKISDKAVYELEDGLEKLGIEIFTYPHKFFVNKEDG